MEHSDLDDEIEREQRELEGQPVEDYQPVELGVLFAMVILLGALYWGFVDIIFEREWRGPFGDKFGGLNALLTGLTMALVGYSLLLQRHELKLQRRELRFARLESMRSRRQMEKQTAQIEEQAGALKKQIEEMQTARLFERVPALRIDNVRYRPGSGPYEVSYKLRVENGLDGAHNIRLRLAWREAGGNAWQWDESYVAFISAEGVFHARATWFFDGPPDISMWACISYMNFSGGEITVWQAFQMTDPEGMPVLAEVNVDGATLKQAGQAFFRLYLGQEESMRWADASTREAVMVQLLKREVLGSGA